MTETALAVPDSPIGSATYDETENQASAIGDPPTGSRKRLWFWRIVTFVLPIIVLIGAVAAVIVMSAFSPEPEDTEDPIKALPVLTQAARTGNTTLKITAQGEVQPRTEINVVSQVGGRITYMSPNYIEGGRFVRGEVLARIDPEEYRLRVVQARARVTQAETVLAREKSEGDQARRDWEELGQGGEPTPLSLREPQLAEAAAMLESARAALSEAEIQLRRTEIRAEFDGRVSTRMVDPGEFVSANTRLGEIYATDIMDVRLPLNALDLRQAGINLGYQADGEGGVPVSLSTDSVGENTVWTGHIVRTDSRFDAQSRVLHAYVEVKDPFGLKSESTQAPLAPGMYVQAQIDGQSLDNVIIIPRSALRGDDQVYVANPDGTLSIKTVSVLSSDRHEAVLGGGLMAGDAVVTSPIRAAADGMKIEIVDRASPETKTTQAED